MFVLRNVRTSVVQFRLCSHEAVLLHVLSLLKKHERIDNSLTDRYSLIADLCGYATEQFVFDLLRKAFVFLVLDAIYILFADASTTAIHLHNL